MCCFSRRFVVLQPRPDSILWVAKDCRALHIVSRSVRVRRRDHHVAHHLSWIPPLSDRRNANQTLGGRVFRPEGQSDSPPNGDVLVSQRELPETGEFKGVRLELSVDSDRKGLEPRLLPQGSRHGADESWHFFTESELNAQLLCKFAGEGEIQLIGSLEESSRLLGRIPRATRDVVELTVAASGNNRHALTTGAAARSCSLQLRRIDIDHDGFTQTGVTAIVAAARTKASHGAESCRMRSNSRRASRVRPR
jgi:hypothetical protein